MIKGIRKNYWLGITAIGVFVGLFYWFQLRPTRIRSHCSQLAEENVKIMRMFGDSKNNFDRSYEKCLSMYD